MIFTPLIYTLIIIFIFFGIKYLSKFYSLDQPSSRKQHLEPTPQVGGLLFVSAFLLIGCIYQLIPSWLIIGSLVTMIIGVIDDRYNIRWVFKFFVQLALAFYLINTFWGNFTHLSLYNYLFPINQILLSFLFVLWFVGIYNAVNLIDGVDGLAGGFMIFLCLFNFFIGNSQFFQINLLLCILLLGFLLFNQRPAKVFMGDSGSLFLGFYVAVSPLLYHQINLSSSNVLNITPFLIISSFLIADTTRVFFTRLISGKSPMTPDTIHFHHLIIRRSGSYLITLFVIFFITVSSIFFALLGEFKGYNQNSMIIHFGLLFLFIITPPAPTYIRFITRFVSPMYSWQKQVKTSLLDNFRTYSVLFMLLVLLCLMIYKIGLDKLYNWEILSSFLLMTIFYYKNRKMDLSIPSLQIFISLFFLQLLWDFEPFIFFKLLIVLIFITLLIFTIQKEIGLLIKNYSALDLIVLFSLLFLITLSLIGFTLNVWLFMTVFSIWFSIGFLLRRKDAIT